MLRMRHEGHGSGVFQDDEVSIILIYILTQYLQSETGSIWPRIPVDPGLMRTTNNGGNMTTEERIKIEARLRAARRMVFDDESQTAVIEECKAKLAEVRRRERVDVYGNMMLNSYA